VKNETNAQKRDRRFLSHEIYNRGSILTDHTTYWENRDGFVLRVLHACADTAGSLWRSELPAATDAVERRARWRLNHLRPGRWLVNLGALTVFALLWFRFGDSSPLPVSLRFLVLLVLVFAGWTAAGHLLRLPWRRWVRSEQDQVLRGEVPTGVPWRPFLLMGSVLGLVLLLVAAAGRADASLFQGSAMGLVGTVAVFIAAGVGFETLVLGLEASVRRLLRLEGP
jgi:hypothetical protein